MEKENEKDIIIWNSFSNILEYSPKINVQTPSSLEFKSHFYDNCEKLLHQYSIFAVSISGGVDSMLLSYYASMYAKKNKAILKLLHINYNNRQSCPKEVEFLKEWAKIIDCELYTKEMDITRQRSSKLREEYEKITRELRFDFYKSFNCPIILGHNHDDCYENIFANLSKQIHFENLFGMSEILCENDIIIVRPFLEIPKKDILAKAHKLNIPYLEDSTPAWSRRGKMRDSLIPIIQDFDSSILKGLDEYVKRTKFLEEFWEKNFNSWRETVNKTSDTEYVVDTTNDFYIENFQQTSFWIKLWFSLEKQTRPSNKSFRQLIEKLSAPFIKNSNYVLSKDVNIQIFERHLLINFT